MSTSSASTTLLTLDAHSFDTTTSTGIVLVDFWAPWCGPCQMQTPILQSLASRVGEQATIAKVNVDEAPELAARFLIRSIPTLILLKDGHVTRQFVGVQSESVLARAILAVTTP
jgi:thioredoxin 1